MTNRDEITQALVSARRATEALLVDVSDSDLRAPHDPQFSPLAWHLGHVAWQQEVWALRRLGGQPPIDAWLDVVYNTFDSVKATRSRRLPGTQRIAAYAAEVRLRTLELLDRLDTEQLAQTGRIFRFLANHERQHTETIGVVRVLAGLYLNPNRGHDSPARIDQGFVPVVGGELMLGTDTDPDSWDNERTCHRQPVGDFLLARHPVSGAEWMEFIDAGGYQDTRWWTAEGTRWRKTARAVAPRFWQHRGKDGWWTRDLAGERQVTEHLPVAHVSWHEATAYARFRHARLPLESEWEAAASWDPSVNRKRRWPWGDEPATGAARLAPTPLSLSILGQHPAGTSATGICDLVGNIWEWTASVFEPYPGFVPQEYRRYSTPWFDGKHRVCRGGSYLTQPEVARCTFRNFFTPEMRAIPIGVRLAKSEDWDSASRPAKV